MPIAYLSFSLSHDLLRYMNKELLAFVAQHIIIDQECTPDTTYDSQDVDYTISPLSTAPLLD